jgi:hypothetical protein
MRPYQIRNSRTTYTAYIGNSAPPTASFLMSQSALIKKDILTANSPQRTHNEYKKPAAFHHFPVSQYPFDIGKTFPLTAAFGPLSTAHSASPGWVIYFIDLQSLARSPLALFRAVYVRLWKTIARSRYLHLMSQGLWGANATSKRGSHLCTLSWVVSEIQNWHLGLVLRGNNNKLL